ncbi:hypothetical protein ACIA5D_51110 [Actinoplanes sp. NPDC051513]|uniref:hypothetical protein n=1 Tax=Actinoplanes sp. NPDC051513 TaxID=3363908 RepID=UPI003793CE79
MKRLHFSPGSSAPLEFGAELWRWDISLYQSAPGVAAALQRAGRDIDDDSIIYRATRTLASDVIDAGGGAESAYERFKRSMSDAYSTYLDWLKTAPAPPEGVSASWALPELEEAWYAIEDLLAWVRRLEERLERSPRGGPSEKQGLIPALAEGPRREAVVQARDRLRASCADEARFLSNLNLHQQSVEGGSKVATVVDGRLFLRFPDRVNAVVGHRYQLTFDEGRDAASVADDVVLAVERFMDEMLIAFESNVPDRFKLPPTAPANLATPS